MATKTRFASSTPSSKEQFSLGSYFRRAWNFLQRENLNRLLLFTTIIILISTVAISLVEPEMTVVNGLWWSIVTMTTVGYGDISPHSLGGRIIAVLMMFFGIGLLGMFSASVASVTPTLA